MNTKKESVSELLFNIVKSELSAVERIMENFAYEGDKNGAIQRILMHLEMASELAIDY